MERTALGRQIATGKAPQRTVDPQRMCCVGCFPSEVRIIGSEVGIREPGGANKQQIRILFTLPPYSESGYYATRFPYFVYMQLYSLTIHYFPMIISELLQHIKYRCLCVRSQFPLGSLRGALLDGGPRRVGSKVRRNMTLVLVLASVHCEISIGVVMLLTKRVRYLGLCD